MKTLYYFLFFVMVFFFEWLYCTIIIKKKICFKSAKFLHKRVYVSKKKKKTSDDSYDFTAWTQSNLILLNKTKWQWKI